MEFKMRAFLEHKGIFKEMLFTETNETKIGYLHSWFFLFDVDKAFFDEFLWLRNEAECKFLFLVHNKDNQPKNQAMKSASDKG